MIIGIPKEIKNHEYRVGVTPAGAKILTDAGHQVHIETGAGDAIGFTDAHYAAAGARIVDTARDVYACPMVIKVKEPQTSEYPLLHEGQLLFTYLHLAPDPQQTHALVMRKIIGIAYETVTDTQGELPLLKPMSEVAGRLAILAGAESLQMSRGGNGTLLGGVPGVAPAKVVVLGGGVAGTQAARMALGLGADVTILDINLTRLRYLDDVFGPALKTRYSEAVAIDELARDADLVIGAVLIPGKQAPKLLKRATVEAMKRGSVCWRPLRVCLRGHPKRLHRSVSSSVKHICIDIDCKQCPICGQEVPRPAVRQDGVPSVHAEETCHVLQDAVQRLSRSRHECRTAGSRQSTRHHGLRRSGAAGIALAAAILIEPTFICYTAMGPMHDPGENRPV